MNILHVGDLHVGNPVRDEKAVFSEIREWAPAADLIVLAGDLTENGKPEEYANARAMMADFRHKTVLVRGNHDLGFYMQEMRDYFDWGVPVQFDPFGIPLHIWQVSWWKASETNHAVLDLPYTLPPPYNQLSQPPIVKLVDGTGPYYSFTRDEYKFIILDTTRWLLGEQQSAWLAHELTEGNLPILIFLHHSILPTGSTIDNCMLWDRDFLLEQLCAHPRILGVFSGHVHYNRRWNICGRKVITTAERSLRMISLKGNGITSAEMVGRCERGRGGCARKAGLATDEPEQAFILRYDWPAHVISQRSFRCFRNLHPSAWVDDYIGWNDPRAPGGLEWSWSNQLTLPSGNTHPWFGIQFVSRSPWTVTVKKDGATVLQKKGAGNGNVISLTEPIDPANARRFHVRLEQAPPAIGHACSYIVFNNCPVTEFNNYDIVKGAAT